MTEILYTVKRGDSLKSVASEFGAAPSEIAERNGLKGEPFEGMKLIVGKQRAFGYTVRPFDTAESIARKFGVSTERLKNINGTEAVFVGQRIFVPTD